jgi:hypothetical protein
LIVTELAMFTRPRDIIRMVVEAGGPEMNPSAISYYDPDTAGTKVAEKWVELFRATRKKFVDDQSRIAISHRAVRLRRADRLVERLEEKLDGDIAKRSPLVHNAIVEQILAVDKQAAMDAGDAFTNRRMLTVGDPEVELAKELGMSVEELRAAVSASRGESDPTAGGDHG